MQQGTDWSKPPFHECTYKCAFIRPFILFSVISLPIFLATVFLTHAVSESASYIETLWLVPVSSFAVGILIPLLGIVIPVRLTNSSISGLNAYGTRQTFLLADVSRVSFPWYNFGQFWIVHSSKSKMKIWIPLFLADIEGFCDGLSRTVAEDHPLRLCVAQHCEKLRGRNT